MPNKFDLLMCMNAGNKQTIYKTTKFIELNKWNCDIGEIVFDSN